MIKKTILFSALFSAPILYGQSTVDFQARLLMDAVEKLSPASRSSLQPVTLPVNVSLNDEYSFILTLSPGYNEQSIDNATILARSGNMLIVRAKLENLSALASNPCVAQLSLGEPVKTNMDMARTETEVSAVQTGAGDLNGLSFTGKGVVAGLMDTGLDVNHINFLNADETPRTKALWTIRGAQGITTTYDTPEKISKFTTDKSGESHGTHVLGIMAGSYNGPAEYAFINSRGLVQIKKQAGANSAIPYYGIATNADLAVSCGDLMGSNIELGASKVIEYAQANNQPCVLNLSLGSTTGPHDGTDARSKWLASLGENAIICIASGNEGDTPVSITKSFTASDNSFKTILASTPQGNGNIEFWGNDAEKFVAKFIAYNLLTGEAEYTYTLDTNTAGVSTTIVGNAYNAAGYIHDDKFNSAFGEKSALIISSNINPANNRYCVQANLQLNGSSSSKIVPAFIIEGNVGQTVDGFTFGDYMFTSQNQDGFTAGSPDCSVNGMACGENVLVVGSYTNRSSWPVVGGGQYFYNNKPVAGEISSFSSYGKIFGGRQLPDVCGPGGSLISSYSKYYAESTGVASDGTASGVYTGSKRKSYWGEMQGTSMATPFVAGVIAIWLEADPSLKIDDIKEVIANTSTCDAATDAAPLRFGAGKINALAGLKYILDQAGINDVVNTHIGVHISQVDSRVFEVYVPGANKVELSLFNLSGSISASTSTYADTASLSAYAQPKGVYVLSVKSDKGAITKKIVLN